MIISAGVLLLFIWIAITFISLGIPLALCERIISVSPVAWQPFLIKMQNGFYYDVPNELMPAEIFFVLFSLAFFIYFIAILFVCKNKKVANNFFIIFLFAFLFRLALIPSTPIYENDIYRYIWDGKVSLAGVNPYKYAPAQAEIMPEGKESLKDFFKLKTLRDEDFTSFDRIGHKSVPTIYPPAAQTSFVFSNLLKRGSIPAMKLVFVFFDILVIFIIYRLLKHFRFNPNMVIVYAWSPIVLKEFANSGHYDSLPILFLLLSLFFVFRNKITTSGVMLALGGLFKLFPLVTIPLFFRRIKLKSVLIICSLVLAGYIPFFIWGRIGPFHVFKGLFVFAKEWSFYGGIFNFLYAAFESLGISVYFGLHILVKIILACIYISVLMLLTLRRNKNDLDFLKKVFWAIAWLFLLSPVADPWYFCWVIPFLCFFPYRSFILLSWLLVFNYLCFTRETGVFLLGNFSIDYLILFQYIPFFILLLKETLFNPKGEIDSVCQA